MFKSLLGLSKSLRIVLDRLGTFMEPFSGDLQSFLVMLVGVEQTHTCLLFPWRFSSIAGCLFQLALIFMFLVFAFDKTFAPIKIYKPSTPGLYQRKLELSSELDEKSRELLKSRKTY